MDTTTALTTLTTRKKIERLLALDKITITDIEGLNDRERRCLEKTATKTLAKLTDQQRDNFLDKLAPILPDSMKNTVWEHNHHEISSAISRYMHRHGAMPTRNNLADETGLSRQTVAKHLSQYRAHPGFEAEVEQFKFMANKVLANVFRYAGDGDMRAARLYLEMVGALNKHQAGTVVTSQNNYIQINNTILSQENLKQLSAEQLQQIENIIINKECKVLA